MTYSIGEVAKKLNVSPQSLRNWEREGLIVKPDRRPTNRNAKNRYTVPSLLS